MDGSPARPDDIEPLKSSPRDIIDGMVTILIPATETFRDEMRNGHTGTGYYILILPKGVEANRFSTLRQAKALGAKFVMDEEPAITEAAGPLPSAHRIAIPALLEQRAQAEMRGNRYEQREP